MTKFIKKKKTVKALGEARESEAAHTTSASGFIGLELFWDFGEYDKSKYQHIFAIAVIADYEPQSIFNL